jgi:O-Antigen ligase
MTEASIARSQTMERWITGPAVMLIVSMATLVHAYLVVKLLLMAVFILAFAVNVFLRRIGIVVYRRLVWFYLCIAVIGIVWAMVGLLHPSNYVQGVYDALRLYVIWSAAFALLYTLLRAGPSLQAMHRAICVAGIVIPLINFLALYDLFSGSGLIPASVRQELALEIGIGDGYLQLGSRNISTMFVIAPYLLALQFRADADKSTSTLTKLALVLSLVLVVLSGRRALWIVVALTPGIILLLSSLTGSGRLMTARGRRFLLMCAAASAVGLSAILILRDIGSESAAVTRLKEAFSSEDERTIQRPYLIDAFTQSPVFGSGFGGYAGYERNEAKPWTYELTYHTMLFNLGIVGTGFLLVLFSVYFFSVIRLLKRFKSDSAVPFGLLVGFCCLLLGAYSNPYLGGFDSLFFAGLLPYLSTFQRGFDRFASTAGGVF